MIRSNPLPDLRRRLALAGLFLLVILGLLSVPDHSLAAISGQLGDSWGKFGIGQGELMDPASMGVDSTDGSVYIASFPSFDFDEYVVQKFSETGTWEGTASIPVVPGFESNGNGLVGIAVDHETVADDPTSGRFYVLEDEKNASSKFVATKILAFETSPQAGELKQVAELPVPSVGSAQELLAPTELALDPSTGNLVVVAENEEGRVVLQQITTSGAGGIGARWVDSAHSLLPSRFGDGSAAAAIAIDQGGKVFVMDSEVLPNQDEIVHAWTLPANFTESSSLAPLAGFSDAVPPAQDAFDIRAASTTEGFNFGSQIAVATVEGEDVLYWKSHGSEDGGSVSYEIVNGFSVDGQVKTVAFGGGSEEAICKLESRATTVGIGADDAIVTFNQGDEVGEPSQTPLSFPYVSRFGAGGTECPDAAIALKFESGGNAITTVPAGHAVTLNGGASELGGATVTGATWTVKGAEEFTESSAGLTATPAGRFTHEGKYKVWLTVETSPLSGSLEWLGRRFSNARPQILEVTAPSGAVEFPLTLTKSGTGSGSFECKIASGPAEPCATEYESGTEVEVIAKPGSGSKFVKWMGACTTTPCVVTLNQAQSVGAEFELESAPVTEFTLTVTPPSGGTLFCNSGSGPVTCATQGKYLSTKVVTLTEAPAAGFEFVSWTGECSGAGPCSVTMSAARTVGATFKAVSSGGGNGGGTGSGPTPAPGGGGTPPPGGGAKPHPKTPAQILAEKRQKAIAKCKKSKGKAKAACLKKARAIGKPKRKEKARDLARRSSAGHLER